MTHIDYQYAAEHNHYGQGCSCLGNMVFIIGAIYFALAMMGGLSGSSSEGTNTAPAPQVGRYSAPPPMTIDTNKSYTALIKTNKGDIKVKLYAKDAPMTVNNFVFLARDGFYDGSTFHHVIPDSLIQGGGPPGFPNGGPGYEFNDENPKTDYEIGSIRMANHGPDTNGSQFFICEGLQCNGRHGRDYNYFGQVIKGRDVVTRIANVPTTLGDDGVRSVPIEEVRIETIEIIER